MHTGLGATFNPEYAREMGRITARDTMAAGIQWIYGPILDLVRGTCIWNGG